ncbi:MAG: glycosyltransferase family 39 protein [Deltaproteobacteria bacterium]|nr:glycosyltransferase family 39 protein [Deltaproteobacteria bacterium]
MMKTRVPSGLEQEPARGGSQRNGAVAALLILLLVGMVLRLVGIFTVGNVPKLHGDERYYVRAARTLLDQGSFPGSFRPPGYAAFIAGSLRVLPWGSRGVQLAQAAVSLVALALVFDLVCRRFGVRPALLSGLLCAVNPTLIHYTSLFWSETLVATLILLVLWCLDRFADEPRSRWLVAARVALGATALTREMHLYFAPFIVAWIVSVRQRPLSSKLSAAMVFAMSVAIAVLPWMMRNHRQIGEFALSMNRWLPAAMGNRPALDGTLLGPGSHAEMVAAYREYPSPVAREAYARRTALDSIAEQQPWWIVRKVARNTDLLFSPTSQLSRYARRGWLPDELRSVATFLVVSEAAAYGVLMSLGIVALWFVPGGHPKALVVAWIIFSWGVYVIANANHRFRVPLLPLFALYAGPLLCGRWVSDRTFRPRLVGALVCLAVFAVVQLGRVRTSPNDETASEEEASTTAESIP